MPDKMPSLTSVLIPMRLDHWRAIQALAADSGLSGSAFIRMLMASAIRRAAREARVDANPES